MLKGPRVLLLGWVLLPDTFPPYTASSPQSLQALVSTIRPMSPSCWETVHYQNELPSFWETGAAARHSSIIIPEVWLSHLLGPVSLSFSSSQEIKQGNRNEHTDIDSIHADGSKVMGWKRGRCTEGYKNWRVKIGHNSSYLSSQHLGAWGKNISVISRTAWPLN